MLAPLLRHAGTDGLGGLGGVLQQLVSQLPSQAGAALVVSSPDIAERFSACLDAAGLRTIRLEAQALAPDTVAASLQLQGVPAELDCLVVDANGQDYWAWQALASHRQPSIVVIAFTAAVGPSIEATVRRAASATTPGAVDQGASYAALCALAGSSGYRLVHLHGPAYLCFLRNEIAFPAALGLKPDLTPEDWALLVNRTGLQASFHAEEAPRTGGWPTTAPDVALAPWEVLAPELPSKPVDIEGLLLHVADKFDTTWYTQRKIFEEKASLLYRFLHDEGFDNVVDVGANVGLISLLARRAHPTLNLVAVEADPRLVRLLRQNFQHHGVERAQVVNAIAGAEDQDSVEFSLNPNSTLDNRVHVAAWKKVRVPMRRLDRLLQRLSLKGRTFFKIDTQGFELQVLQGLEDYLMNDAQWVLKMEFAPNWLRSQGTDPAALLDHLQLRYEFAEYPERIVFGTPDMNALFARTVGYRQQPEFLRHVVAQNRNGLGWVDLIVRPKRG